MITYIGSIAPVSAETAYEFQLTADIRYGAGATSYTGGDSSGYVDGEPFGIIDPTVVNGITIDLLYAYSESSPTAETNIELALSSGGASVPSNAFTSIQFTDASTNVRTLTRLGSSDPNGYEAYGGLIRAWSWPIASSNVFDVSGVYTVTIVF